MAIEWRSGFETGMSVIDIDHKKLISICNNILAQLEKVTEVEDEQLDQEIYHTFQELQDYTKTHFKREEMIMKTIGFDEYRQHVVHHKDLIKVLIQVYHSYKAARNDGNLEENLKQVSTVLHHWLVDHVIKEDLKMKPFARNHLASLPTS
jgi:hemerythrin